MGLEEKFRSAAIGHEPGEPGRQLEQQREPLPRREPQQQQPDELQQQRGVSLRPQLRPNAPDGAMSMGLNRPPSRSQPVSGCDKTTPRPPGAGSPVDAGSNAPGGSWASHAQRRSQTAAATRPMRGPVAALCERRCQRNAIWKALHPLPAAAQQAGCPFFETGWKPVLQPRGRPEYFLNCLVKLLQMNHEFNN